MNKTDFEIRLIRQHWRDDDGKEHRDDLCSHGEIYLRIADEELLTKDSGSWSTTATGLFLLRSLEQNCELNEFEGQLISCCGHMWIPNEQGKNYVQIMDCNSGVDWSIHHIAEDSQLANTVVYKSITGANGKLLFDDYKKMVLKFAEDIEQFYGNPIDKDIGNDDWTIRGFKQFWAEWKEHRIKWN